MLEDNPDGFLSAKTIENPTERKGGNGYSAGHLGDYIKAIKP